MNPLRFFTRRRARARTPQPGTPLTRSLTPFTAAKLCAATRNAAQEYAPLRAGITPGEPLQHTPLGVLASTAEHEEERIMVGLALNRALMDCNRQR